MNLTAWVRSMVGVTLRFFLPWACAGCRTPLESIEDQGFCGLCWLQIRRIDGLICQACGVPLKDGGNLCFGCHQKPIKLLVRAAADYSFPLQPAIHRFKYAGRKTLQVAFRPLLEYGLNQYPELQPVDALVPVPLHPSTFRDRGYNQAALLGQALASVIGRPVHSDVLVRTRRTLPQFRLRKTERMTNLQDAFALAPGLTPASLKGLHLLLIDDVCTTGATLQECARVLKTAGAARVKALVLARDI